MRILISGYYGFGNIGDELILTSLIQQLRTRYSSPEIHVLSAAPQQTLRLHGVQGRSRWNPITILREVWKADLFVLGGGGLIQDTTSARSLKYYLLLTWLAKIVGCQIVLFAVGVESVRNKLNRQLTRWILDGESLILTVRDLESKALFVEMGLPAQRIHVTGDPVFLLPSLVPHVSRFSQASNRLVFIPRFPTPSEGDNLYRTLLISLRETHRMELSGILFSPSNEEKELLSSAVTQVISPDLFLLTESAETVIKEISKADYVVSARFHGLVLAALMGRPFLGLGDEEKVGRFCRVWGRPYIPWTADSLMVEQRISELLDGTIHPSPEMVVDWKVRAGTTIDYLLSSEKPQS